ncbi:HD domain-containing protein, partial [Streptomyces sp. NPDC059525]|uniref:HD domain-containing protein n=1 Tax=Streptomyces sp. NPDC059525 TaxID=3346857 RepID=UPI0036B52F04
HTPAIANHVVRSWLWAEAFAIVEGRTDVDHELLYTAAILHDIGLVPAYDNHALGYEEAGGFVGEALTAGLRPGPPAAPVRGRLRRGLGGLPGQPGVRLRERREGLVGGAAVMGVARVVGQREPLNGGSGRRDLSLSKS